MLVFLQEKTILFFKFLKEFVIPKALESYSRTSLLAYMTLSLLVAVALSRAKFSYFSAGFFAAVTFFAAGTLHATISIVVRSLLLPSILAKYAQHLPFIRPIPALNEKSKDVNSLHIGQLEAQYNAGANVSFAGKKVLINFNPQAGSYPFKAIPDFGYKEGELIKVRFHYTDVAGSRGSFVTQKDLILSSSDVIRYFIDEKKVPPENIILYGQSLGGAIATLSLAELIQKNPEKQKDYEKITLVSSRSFSRLSMLISRLKLPKFIETPMISFMDFALKAMDFDFDVATAWNGVLKNVRKLYLAVDRDPIIPAEAAMSAAIHDPHEVLKLDVKSLPPKIDRHDVFLAHLAPSFNPDITVDDAVKAYLFTNRSRVRGLPQQHKKGS